MVLFIAGFAIAGAAFAIANNPYPEEGLTAQQKFFWAEIFVCYFVFAVPFFFSSISSKNIDTKITSTVHIWLSVIIFEIVAIIFAVRVLHGISSIKTALIVELVLFFLLMIFVYFGYFAGAKIADVQAKEQVSLSKIAELKTAFDMLGLKAGTWGEDLFEQKTKVRKLCDDAKYLSPVDTDQAANLENKLIIAANVLAESRLTPQETDAKIAEISGLISQRKLLRK